MGKARYSRAHEVLMQVCQDGCNLRDAIKYYFWNLESSSKNLKKDILDLFGMIDTK